MKKLLSWIKFLWELFWVNTEEEFEKFLLSKFNLSTLVKVIGTTILGLIGITAIKDEGMTETLKVIINYIKDIVGMI